MSPSTRRVWVEIIVHSMSQYNTNTVTLHAEGVD